MAQGYRATLGNRLGNKIVSILLRLGVTPGRMALLTVPGRKTGLPRSTPVAVGERDGRRWLIAAFGEVNWVRNLRAAGAGTIRRGRRTEAITVVELPPKEAAPILKEALTSGPSFIRPYFDATPESPLSDFEREAARHPVFLIQATSTQI